MGTPGPGLGTPTFTESSDQSGAAGTGPPRLPASPRSPSAPAAPSVTRASPAAAPPASTEPSGRGSPSLTRGSGTVGSVSVAFEMAKTPPQSQSPGPRGVCCRQHHVRPALGVPPPQCPLPRRRAFRAGSLGPAGGSPACGWSVPRVAPPGRASGRDLLLPNLCGASSSCLLRVSPGRGALWTEPLDFPGNAPMSSRTGSNLCLKLSLELARPW